MRSTVSRSTVPYRFSVQNKTQSIGINGTTQYATSPVVPATTGFCMALWVRPGGIGNQDAVGNHIVDWETAFNTDGFRLCLGVSPHKATLTINSGASSTVSISTADRSNLKGEWYHFAITFKPNEAKLYVNGTLIATDTSCAMSTATGQTLTFGKRSFTTATPREFLGDYKEIVIHNTTTPWTAEQVKQIYYNSVIPSGVTAYYPLNGDVLDHSGNGNDLTVSTIVFSNRVPGHFYPRRQPIADISADIVQGNAAGQVIEIDATTRIRGAGRNVYQSTDGGQNWTLKYTSPGTQDEIGLMQRTTDGNLYVGFSNRSVSVVDLIRSTDNGASWSVVLTSESTAWRYYMAEDSQQNLYIAEYSAGNQDANELYGYNVWKSTDHGANWTKFYTAPMQSTPGAKDGTRHIHYIFCDSDDQLYIGFGDIGLGFGYPSGRVFRLNSNGTLGDEITASSQLPEGNGMLTAVETDTGKLLFIGDLYPYKVYTLDKSSNEFERMDNIGFGYDNASNPSTWDIVKGKDGVIYILAYGVPGAIEPVMFASADDGASWKTLRFTQNRSFQINVMSLNRDYANSRIYIHAPNNNYISIPDYTRAQLNALGPSRSLV